MVGGRLAESVLASDSEVEFMCNIQLQPEMWQEDARMVKDSTKISQEARTPARQWCRANLEAFAGHMQQSTHVSGGRPGIGSLTTFEAH